MVPDGYCCVLQVVWTAVQPTKLSMRASAASLLSKQWETAKTEEYAQLTRAESDLREDGEKSHRREGNTRRKSEGFRHIQGRQHSFPLASCVPKGTAPESLGHCITLAGPGSRKCFGVPSSSGPALENVYPSFGWIAVERKVGTGLVS